MAFGRSPTADAEALAFDPFELDLRAGALRRGGTAVALRPKAWQMLVHLATRPGLLIATEDLYDAVWGDTAVSPNAMTNVVGELRRVLDDLGPRPVFIETVRGRGYRFIADVKPRAGATPPAVAAAIIAADPFRSRAMPGFVGRNAELARLASIRAEADGGRRQAVFVSGEPGIGKTTLVERFSAGLTESSVLRVCCVEAEGGGEAYQPILHLLEQLLCSTRRDDVVGLLRRHAPTWLDQLPGLLPDDEARELRRSMIGVGAARMLREGAALLEELTRDWPLTIVLEDLHWADPPTCELLSTLMQRSGVARLLVLGTYRPIDAVVRGHPIAAVVAKLRRREDVTVLPLSAFSIDEVRRCLEHELGEPDLADKLALMVGRHSGGNPLFVKAIGLQLCEEGWLRQVDGVWEPTVDLARFVPRFPEDLRDLIELQIAALPQDSLRVLEVASVVGSDITAGLLADILEWPTEQVEDICHGLARRALYLRGVVVGVAGQDEAPETYAFTHALYQRAFHDRIAPSQRRRLHGRVGACLERVHASHPSEAATRLAGHFEIAGDFDRAARYREMAAGVSLHRFAYGEAARDLETALVHLEKLADGADVAARRARLYLSLGNTRLGLRGYAHASVSDAFERAEHAARACGDVRAQVRALSGLASVRLGSGNPGAGLPVVARQVELVGAGELAQYAYVRAANVHLQIGDLLAAEGYLERAAQWAPEPGVPMLIDALSEEEAWRALVLTQLGRLDQGREAAERALRRAEEAALAWGRGVTVYLVLEMSMLQRDYGRAAALADALLENAQRHGLATQVPIAEFHRLYLRDFFDGPQQGAREAPTRPRIQAHEATKGCAVDGMRRRLREHEALGEQWHRTAHLAALADMELRTRDLDGAEATLNTAFSHAAWGGEGRYLPELWRLRGELFRLRSGAADEAERCFRRAIEIAAGSHSSLFELRATVALARLLGEEGRKAEAADLLGRVLIAFGDGGDGADLRAAADLGRSLGC